MAEKPEFTDTVEKKTEEAIGRLIDELDWDDEKKRTLHKEYMTEFSTVLREMMPMIESLYAGKKPTLTESTDSDAEALEAAKVRHEATVLGVAKRRKEYPPYLAKLLGKTMRLKKNIVVATKIDLPLSEPMEGLGAVDQEDLSFDALIGEANDSLLGPTQNILTDTERLADLAAFAKVSLQEDPISALFQEVDTMPVIPRERRLRTPTPC